jgi:hypothetical protein
MKHSVTWAEQLAIAALAITMRDYPSDFFRLVAQFGFQQSFTAL